MNIAIIHLSDLHYRKDWIENHGIVLDMFFKDLAKQIQQIGSSNIYLAFSGDAVQAGHDTALYDEFLHQFDNKLNDMNIPKSRRICVPGNHDVSIKQITSISVDHEGVVSQGLDESRFNDYVSNPSNVFTDKFSQYGAFESRFVEFGALSSTKTGAGWEIADNIGVYCLNTALCSSGGLQGSGGTKLLDKKRLAIDTRCLHAWILSCEARWKILLMHHPLNWLTDWAQRELKAILRKDFSLCLSGHAHDQSTLHSVSNADSLVECSAPPLFTKKTDDLGYSIISVSSAIGVIDITYRQWTKHQSFVTGVNFSNTDDGKVRIIVTAQRNFCLYYYLGPQVWQLTVEKQAQCMA